MSRTLRILSLLLLASVLGCTAPSAQRDGEWVLSSLQGAPAAAPRPTLTISGAQMGGFTGCNRLTAEIETDPNVAAFFRGSAGVTEMYWEANAAMEMERAFLDALNRTGDVRVEAGVLVFFDVSNREIMRFERTGGGG